MMKVSFVNKNGITLISLVITIIVLLILAGVTIATLTGDNGILTQADRAKISTELAQYKEKLDLYIAAKQLENNNFLEDSLTAGKSNLFYNTQPEGETGNIYTILPELETSEFVDKLEIIKGELLLTSQNRGELEIAKGLGIAINPYKIVDGVLLSSDVNLLLMDSDGTVTIPDTVTEIGEGAFADLKGLKTIIIPGTVKIIGKGAFRNNQDLENVIMQEGVETIRELAFSGCRSLKEISFPESLTTIEAQTFYNCSSLKEIVLPSKIKEISVYTFCLCSNLESVKLPDNLETIRAHAFSYCYKLNDFRIPETVSLLEANVFASCFELENIIIEGANSNYVYESGILMPKDKKQIIFISDKKLKNTSVFSIPEGIETFSMTINSYKNIKQLNIPNSLKTISAATLPDSIEKVEIGSNNPNLSVENNIIYSKDYTKLYACFSKDTTIQINEKTQDILDHSFSGATNLEYITLPDSVISINSGVFSNNTNLKELVIGKNVKNIYPLFKHGNYSGIVKISSENPNYTIEDNILYNKDKTTLITVLYQIVGDFTVAPKVKIIENFAFHSQTKMTNIQLNNDLKEIRNSFNYCNELTEIEIPSSVEKIGSTAFNSSAKLEKIRINKPKDSIAGSPFGAVKGDRVVEWNG